MKAFVVCLEHVGGETLRKAVGGLTVETHPSRASSLTNLWYGSLKNSYDLR